MADFRIGVQVILLEDRHILLGRRLNGYGHNTWGLPGGHLEPGESFEEAAGREVREETGLRVKTLRVFGVANDPSAHAHHVQIGLIAHQWSGVLRVSEPHRCEEWLFWPLRALPTPLFPSSAPLIEQYKRLPGRRRAWALRWLAQVGKQQSITLDRLVLKL